MISVAMGTYNGARFIEKQLKSILNQTLIPDEVIICDDRSSDNTIEIVRSFIETNHLDSWKIYKNEVNLGFAANFLNAIQLCRGDLIFLCDQDDIWLEKKVEIMSQIMYSHPNIWSLASNFTCIDAEDQPIERPHPQYPTQPLSMILLSKFIKYWAFPGMSMVITDELKQLLMSEESASFIAHDFAANALACTLGKMYFCNEVFTLYRQHGNNVYGMTQGTRSIDQRVSELLNAQKHVVHTIKLLEDLPPCLLDNQLEITPQKEYLIKLLNSLTARVHTLQNKSFLNMLRLLSVVKYITWKTLAGDMIYFLGLEKYFN